MNLLLVRHNVQSMDGQLEQPLWFGTYCYVLYSTNGLDCTFLTLKLWSGDDNSMKIRGDSILSVHKQHLFVGLQRVLLNLIPERY